ncbi:MAG: hypothetical protein CML08_01425 [Puniceicoccaceae bacterium]|nr:hypothetical protein [Puniceicoccaceae bacterium]
MLNKKEIPHKCKPKMANALKRRRSPQRKKPAPLMKKGKNTLLKRFKPKDSSKNSLIRTEQLLHFF